MKSLAGDSGGRAAKIIVTRGGSPVAEARAGRGGAFRLAVPDAPELVLTIIGEDRRVLRRRVKARRGGQLDLGNLKLPVEEFVPGIAGQAWDVAEDRPVPGGRATLRRDGTLVATAPIDGSGAFAIELTERTLLLAGTYHLIVEVAGYRSAKRTIEITDDVTSYRLGRIELIAKTAA
ncbi:MAG TPA: hypothetical protein VJ790_13830 [Dongiaceae bacterium]|nr:hypothetical protein [Dongiaceae bacterium]